MTKPQTTPTPSTGPDAGAATPPVDVEALIAKEIAGLIAHELGFPYELQHVNKTEWNRTRGLKGGRYHDINEPMQPDFDVAAEAVIKRLRASSVSPAVDDGAALARARHALRSLQDGAAIAIAIAPEEGAVADFLAAIHRTAAQGLLADDSVTNEAALAKEQS